MEQAVQMIGLIVALCYILFGIDDFFWDVLNIVRKIRNGETKQLPFEELDAVPPKLLAMMVAAWREDNVIEPVIDNMLASLQYPQSMYHIFIGVYPNDEPTVSAVKRLTEKYANVHMVINCKPGPTCKADNLNNILRFIRQFEKERQWRFCSVTVHDSEDVIHPYELKLTNYLIDTHAALQFPVIPLQKMPTVKTILSDMTTGTYADEFAENHYRTMGTREAMSAVVPSAGTGFVLSRRILDDYKGQQLFPEDSLTEDYKLSLLLAKRGYPIHFVLEKVPRLMDNNTVRWDYVATRSFFPDTFETAVRQKTRWIYGITMQSVRSADILKESKMGFAARYSLYKDLKAKASNLMVLPGYLVFLYFILSLVTPLPMMYPQGSFAWGLCILLTIMMVFRQTMRAVAIANFYGLKSMIVSCLLPPLLPARLAWGNIINMTATFRAWRLYIWGSGTKRKSRKVAWSKTDHTFLQKHVLYRYYRTLGDVLLEKQYVDVVTLSQALAKSRREGVRLGETLLDNGDVTEEQLMEAVAGSQHKLFVRNLNCFGSRLAADFDRERLKTLLMYPLLRTDGAVVFAVTDRTPVDQIPEQLGIPADCCHFAYTTARNILQALDAENEEPALYQQVSGLLHSGQLTWEQAVLALNRHQAADNILVYMGLDSIRENAHEVA